MPEARPADSIRNCFRVSLGRLTPGFQTALDFSGRDTQTMQRLADHLQTRFQFRLHNPGQAETPDIVCLRKTFHPHNNRKPWSSQANGIKNSFDVRNGRDGHQSQTGPGNSGGIQNDGT